MFMVDGEPKSVKFDIGFGRLRQRRPRPSNRWHLDEMVVRIVRR
jgi:hypothetical protein